MPDERWLTAAEAIARLGVKPQTLYAYVSRGLIRRERPAGSRTSRYARRDVERLAGHGRRDRAAPGPRSSIDQAITALDPAGHLAYRGWDATRAAVDAHYEQVAAWLWGTTFGPNDHWTADPDGLARDRAGRAGRAPGGDAPPGPAPRRRRRAPRRRSVARRPARRGRGRARRHTPRHPGRGAAAGRPARRADRRPAHWRTDSGRACRRSNRRPGACGRSTARCRSSPTTSSRRRRSRCGSPPPPGPIPTCCSSPASRRRAVRCTAGRRSSSATLLRDAVATDAETGRRPRAARRPAGPRVRSRGLRGSRSAGAGAPRRGRGGAGRPATSGAPPRACST